MATNRKAPADQTIDLICKSLSGAQWDAQLANRIAEIVTRAGYKIPEPEVPAAPACCPTCKRTDEIAIRESYIVLHPYDATTHEAEEEEPDPDEGEGDFIGYCSSCGTKGDLATFGIPANFAWVGCD